MFGFSSKDPKDTEKDNEVQDNIIFQPHRRLNSERRSMDTEMTDAPTISDTDSDLSGDGVPLTPVFTPEKKSKMGIEWTVEECKEHLFCKTASDRQGTVDHMNGNTHYFTTTAEKLGRRYFTPMDWGARAKKLAAFGHKKRDAGGEKSIGAQEKTAKNPERLQDIPGPSTQEQTSLSDSDKIYGTTTRTHRDSSISMSEVPEHMSLGQILPPREQKDAGIMSTGNIPSLIVTEDTDGGVPLSSPLPATIPSTESLSMWETVDDNAVRCDMIAEEDEEALAGVNDPEPAADQDKANGTTNGDKPAVKDDDQVDVQEMNGGKPSTPRGEEFPAYGTNFIGYIRHLLHVTSRPHSSSRSRY
ncbi:hypothetical protein F5884DRAFT_775283 [Xylogone sp. PMI_703]|nr:hypothetical protein F5884DRAFT_775283 [Xylogone sp. PMI_703]